MLSRLLNEGGGTTATATTVLSGLSRCTQAYQMHSIKRILHFYAGLFLVCLLFRQVPAYFLLLIFYFFLTLFLSSLCTSRGHSCRPFFPPDPCL